MKAKNHDSQSRKRHQNSNGLELGNMLVTPCKAKPLGSIYGSCNIRLLTESFGALTIKEHTINVVIGARVWALAARRCCERMSKEHLVAEWHGFNLERDVWRHGCTRITAVLLNLQMHRLSERFEFNGEASV